MEITLLVLIVLTILLSAFMLYREFQHVSRRMEKLEETSSEKSRALEQLEVRMKKLEQANRKRMPWEALEKLLNAKAALDREKEERQLGISFIENAEAWIDQVMASGTKREAREE